VVDLPGKSRYLTALRSWFTTRSYGQVKYWNHKFQSTVDGLLEKECFDVIWVNTLDMTAYLEQFLHDNQSRPLLVLDQQNVDDLYYKSFLVNSTSIAWKMCAALEVVKARRLQKRWFPRFDAILCVAPEDLQTTAKYVDARTSLWLAPNGVDTEYFQPVARQNLTQRTPKLVFGGSMDVAMNQDAVRWFVASILPCLKQQVPDVQFWIVGRNPPAAIQSLAERPGIRVTGSVPDVREYYRQADVFVVPLRLGGGTKLKTLEAMALGLPVVSTTVGAQGLDVESGRHLYIANDPQVLAAHVVELLADRRKASAMGVAARQLVEQQYSWTSIVGEVDRKLTDLFHKRCGD
jgi:glycosyltransferase involved in cell wall biosynthesis